MKRTWTALLCAAGAASLMLLAACSPDGADHKNDASGGKVASTVSSVLNSEQSGGTSSTQADELKIAEIGETLAAEIPFDQKPDLKDKAFAEEQYQLTDNEVEDAVLYMGVGGASADEISVWKAKNEASVKAIQEKVEKRIQIQKESYADYRPEEVPKLEDPVVVTKGNVVIVCVSGHNDKAKEIIDSLVK